MVLKQFSLRNFTQLVNDKETASKREILKWKDFLEEIVFSCKTYSNNLCFIYNFENHFYSVDFGDFFNE